MVILARRRRNAQAILLYPQDGPKLLKLVSSYDRNSSRPIQDGSAFVAADGSGFADARLPSLRRRRRDLSTWRGANPEPGAVPCGPGIFPVARQHDAVPEPGGIFVPPDSSAVRGRTACVACRFDFSSAFVLLAVELNSLFVRERSLGVGVPDRGVADHSRCWNCALPHGPVFESAKPGGVCGGLRCDENSGTKISSGISLDPICRGRASADVGLPFFILLTLDRARAN